MAKVFFKQAVLVKPRREPGEERLRDEFAIAVLPAAMRNFYEAGEAWDGHDDVAAHCYNVADAMLAARKK
jgi:hypothetical protein